MVDYPYDIESLPNIFSLTAMSAETGEIWAFETSDRRNDMTHLVGFLHWLRDTGARMVGYNNVGYDYILTHFILENYMRGLTAADIRVQSDKIINTPFERRWDSHVKPWEVMIPQVDLMLIHHFDNKNKRTTLKTLEFNMRSDTIEELPFGFDVFVTAEQAQQVMDYNGHDVIKTYDFYKHSKEMIAFRDELTATYDLDFTNYNDTKIGKQYFAMQLEKDQPGICYTRIPGQGKVPNQTPRDRIVIADVIFPYISELGFKRPEFQRVFDYMRVQTITQTKEPPEFKNLTCEIYGLTYHFGAGGIHASVEAQTIESDERMMILDLDVSSYYPSVGIANNLSPAHLGDKFCTHYAALKAQRINYAKGSAPNAMLKLALNGVYGDTNQEYSPFLDPQYLISTTINGQFLLCVLADLLLPIEDLDIIQMNTDGITISFPRVHLSAVKSACDWWQRFTLLTLEEVEYARMFIRDVSNYMAEDVHGNLKHVGAYKHYPALMNKGKKGKDWNSDHGALVVPMAAEYALLNRCDVDGFIRAHIDPHDFTICTKLQRTSYLMHGDVKVQNTSRYYVSTKGDFLTKMMPPLTHKGQTEFRKISIKAGYLTKVCNNMKDFDPALINYDWYIAEARKLVEVVR